MQPNITAPAPWTLKGDAYIMLYRFPKAFSRNYGFMDAYQQKALKGWIGAVMLVDYKESEVGPYRELLFIPGLCRINGRLAFSISKIYVSTYDSLWNGHNNWGIPKELADFKIDRNRDGSFSFDVSMADNNFFHACLTPGGFRFPLSTSIFPFIGLRQKKDKKLFRTRPRVKGKAQLSFVKELEVKEEYFPPIQDLSPLAVLHMKDFKMKFPVAKISG